PVTPPPLDEEAVGAILSLRQSMEKHRADPACATCHNKMDPLGFGLENYDAIGHWRTKDGKFDVDSSGTLPNGKTFPNPVEMRSVFRTQPPAFTRCITEKMLTYSSGRGLNGPDNRVVADIDRKLAADGYGFQTLIYEIVRSLPFQSRRGELVKP